KIPADGGEETQVLPAGSVLDNFVFTVTRVGVYYVSHLSTTYLLRLYQPADRKTVDLAHFDKPVALYVSVSPDERWFAWAQDDNRENNFILVENFRERRARDRCPRQGHLHVIVRARFGSRCRESLTRVLKPSR